MSEVKLSNSKIFCKYLFDPDLIVKAKDYGLKLYRQATDLEIDENFVDFICEEVITGWHDVFDPDGQQLEFNRVYLYQVFNERPELLIEIVKHSSKIDNFSQVA